MFRHACFLLLSLPGAALAQNAPGKKAAVEKPVVEAPAWKLGDRWVVQLFVRDLDGAVTGRPKPKEPGLPGFPPLRKGVPEGFKKGGRFQFEVLKDDATLPEPDDDAAKPKPGEKPKPPAKDAEKYFVIQVKPLRPGATRKALLYFAVSDRSLGEIQIVTGQRNQATKCFGTCVFRSPTSVTFGFPFDWPDFIAARQKEQKLRVLHQRLVQTTKRAKGELSVRLYDRGIEKARRAESAVTTTWKKGGLWWTNFDSPSMKATLVQERPANSKGG